MIADLSLARRIEGAEARLSQGLVESARHQHPEAFAVALGGGLGHAVYAGPGSPISKLIGVGLDGPIEGGALDEVEARFFAHGAAVQAEVCSLASPELFGLLCRRGYVLAGFEDVLGRPVGEALPPAAIAVEAVSDATAPEWLATLVEGFGQPDGSGPGLGVDEPSREVLAAIFRQFLRTPGFRGYVARLDGRPAGAASLRIDLGVAQLCGATTLPAFRRRGVQSALLDARLAVAREAGCDLAVVTTSPGSASQANARRRGFAQLYTRALLVKAPPA